jgi:hypothetical protein
MLIQISARDGTGQRNDVAGVAKAARGGKTKKGEELNAELAEGPRSAQRRVIADQVRKVFRSNEPGRLALAPMLCLLLCLSKGLK